MNLREAVGKCLALLSPADRRRLALVTLAQIATSVLDLVGVLLLGLAGALAVTTVQGTPPPSAVQAAVDFLGLGSLTSAQLLGWIAVSAAVLLLVKSILSSYLLRRVFRFLASRQATVSASLTRALLARPLTFVQLRSSQETAYALVQGVGSATLIMLGQATVFVSEFSLLVLLGVFLLIVDPPVALISILFFSLVALALQWSLGRWAMRSSASLAASDIKSLDSIQEAVNSYREIVVSDRRDSYAARLEALRWQAAQHSADLQFISTLPKYVFEVALVIGGFALAAALFSTQDVVAATGTLALFLAAASRVMPSILRLQGASLMMRNAAGTALSTLALADSVGSRDEGTGLRPKPSLTSTGMHEPAESFDPAIEVTSVTFTYPNSPVAAIADVSLRVPSGSSTALVGASGAGKSTLADLILGVLEPQQGSVLLGSVAPQDAVRRWPGGVGYVPQEVALANASVRANVALGLPEDEIDDNLVWQALERARLNDIFEADPHGLSTVIGERGFRLSGGQKQRLGIARALYTRPRLMVLDEATSSLDAQTERAIAETLADFEGSVTTVIIAHRLSTITSVDQVLYVEAGSILARGSFDDVRHQVPAFDRQAEIMGL